jgi:hypothetical protein
VLGIFVYLVRAPLMWLVVPLFGPIVELPIAIARGLCSGRRRIHADTHWPNEVRIAWRTDRRDAQAAADHVVARLAHGYRGLTHPRAEQVPMEVPAWLRHQS